MEYGNRSETSARMWQAVLLSWWLFGTLASCCPQYCRCFTDDDGYKVANCSKSGLLSTDPAPTIDILNFKNQVRGTQTKLEARIFRNFRGVKYLNLRNTSISQLPTDVFYGLSRVSRLDLSYNKIKHLNGVVFKGLPNLRYLSLRGNFLSISPLEVIVSETLQDLDMGFCSLTNIPLYTFSSAPNIRQLILDGNFIQTLEYNVLPKGVTYLNLANNNIVKPPINVFNSLRRLIRLDISNNPINCSCSLLVFQDTLSGRAGMLENGVRCNNPSHLFGREISTVNENQLCRDDFMNREGLNSFVHLRTKKSHHHNNNQYNVQSDDQFMGDESYGQREAAEVMFTNDETNQMGTHMEARIQGSVSPHAYGDASENNKVTQSSDGIETLVHDDDDGYRNSEDANGTDQENHLTTKEDDDDREQLEDGHQSIGTGATENASVEDHSTKSEDFSESNRKSETDDNLVSHQTDHFNGDHGSSHEESASTNNNINTISFDASSSSNDPTNSLHGSEPATQYTTLTDGMSSQSGMVRHEPSLSPESLLMTEDDNERDSTASNMTDDVDVLDTISSEHEMFSHLEMDNDYFTTTESSTLHDLVIIPASPTEPSDYNYDAHHDYGTGDSTTSSETSDDSPSPTEITHDSAPSSSTSETDLDNEGSGDYTELTSSENIASSSSTVKFMEEQEPETESSSLRTVSDDLTDISSSTVPSSTDVIFSSSTDTSTIDEAWSSTTEESSILDQLTTEPTIVSSETPSTETSSPSSESSSPSTESSSPSTESSSPSTESSSPSTELFSPSSESSSPSSESSSTEPITTETSSEASSPSSSEDPTTIEEATTEQVTVPSVPSSSSETSSTLSDTSTEVASSTAAISWELSSTIEPSSSTESSSKRGFWWESDEELSSPSSSPSTVEYVQSSSLAPVYKRPKMIEFTTERSTTEVNEVEVFTKSIGDAHNENIIVDTNQAEEEKTALISGVTYIIIGLLLALVLILLTVVVCRRKSPTKVRLPVDPETAAGTEMQDMLLPKSTTGNGVKVGRPNSYTNGSAAPITNGKPKLDSAQIQDPEEIVPVLLADPEQETEPPEPEIAWDDKPEPIEAVTARLTMLARPQTPIFIQKPLA